MAKTHLGICGETYEIVTVDFETFYDTKRDYSLSKLSMSEYVRDPRFQTIGASIKIGDGPTNWYQGYEIVQTVLDTIDWSKSALLAQNTCFDGLILNEQYGVIPAFYLDTKHMGSALLPKGFKLGLDPMARMFGLAGKVHGDALKSADGWHYEDFTEDMLYNMGVYCNEDVEMTAALFEQFYPAIPDDELELIDLTLRMYCVPTFVVDRDKVRAELEREIAAKDAAVAKTNLQLVALMSNVQFAAHLKSLGVDPPMKLNKKGVETFAFAKTDEEFTNLKEHPNEEVANAVLARLMVKSTINETRAKRFLAVTEHKATMPACLKYSAAISHRWAGADRINLQNLRRKGPLRKALLAPEGCVVVVRDSSQIEARTIAWWAGQLDLVKAFRDGEKIYEGMASSIFNKPVEAIGKDSDERFVGKVSVLGLSYGMSAAKFGSTLSSGAMGRKVLLEEHLVEKTVRLYRARNNYIVRSWREAAGVLDRMASGLNGNFNGIEYTGTTMRLPNGLFIQYPNLRLTPKLVEGTYEYEEYEMTYQGRGKSRKRIYGPLLVENLIQALARCVIGYQMLLCKRAGYRPVMTTHDEIVVVVRKELADKALEDLGYIMRQVPTWGEGIPIDSEGGYDFCYSK